MIRTILILAFIVGATSALAQLDDPAAFQDPDAVEAEIQRCLVEADGDVVGATITACAGESLDICLGHGENATTTGSIRCFSAAAEAWDRQLNAFYLRALEQLNADGDRALRDTQRAWIAFRDKACAVWPHVFEGGSLGRLVSADCVREITMQRALQLGAITDALAVK